MKTPYYLAFGMILAIGVLSIGLCSIMSGCASFSGQSAGSIVGDVVTDVTTGAEVASDAFTALSAAQQAMGGHGVSVANVGAYANAEVSAANTSGLATAVANLTTDITNQLNAGATPAQVSAQLTTAQVALAAAVNPPAGTNSTVTPAVPTSLYIRPVFGEHDAYAVELSGHKRTINYQPE